MKQLHLKTESYRYLEQGFREWLDVLGYSWQSVYGMPNCIREMLHHFEQQGIINIHQITNKKIKEYYRNLKMRPNMRRGGGLGSGTLNKHLQAIDKFMDYLRQSGRLTTPKLYIKKEEKQDKKITVLTPKEIKLLYESTYGYNEGSLLEPINARDRAMLSVFYGCGLRRNEAYHLNIDDINYDRGIIHVIKGKNYKERFVPFNKMNAKYLQDYQYESRPRMTHDRKEEAFFISKMRKRMSGQSMLIRLKILIQRVDNQQLNEKEVGLHTLRHTIATHLLSAGMKLESISKFLGHSSLESTQIYTHLLENENTAL